MMEKVEVILVILQSDEPTLKAMFVLISEKTYEEVSEVICFPKLKF